MKVGVTSENKLKVNAVRGAYDSISLPAEVTGYKADSGIGEQPVNELALTGARNRISDLRKRISGLDRVVSIESGIFEENGEWVDRAVIVILDTQKKEEHIAYSEGVIFPKEYVDMARSLGFDKVTVGRVMEDAGYIVDNKDPHRSISGKSRQEYIEETLGKLVKKVERA